MGRPTDNNSGRGRGLGVPGDEAQRMSERRDAAIGRRHITKQRWRGGGGGGEGNKGTRLDHVQCAGSGLHVSYHHIVGRS
jgi:hypothetical protein